VIFVTHFPAFRRFVAFVAYTTDMPSTLVIVGFCLLVVSVALFRGVPTAVRGGRWLGGAGRGLVGLLLLALAALAATITVGIRGYRRSLMKRWRLL